ncbi:carbohydrate ABC transporter permease [Neobacillus niacini]|uniref:carbohydrate ABC transporter permease n=1 Tax=Neobacillus niacini TaxID=86668 RepID=UPI002FFF51C1
MIRKTNNLQNILTGSILMAGSLIMVTPFIWMILTAFKTPAELNQWPPSILPDQLHFQNFIEVFQKITIPQYLLNSLGVAVISSLSIVLTSTLSGYIFAKFHFRGKNLLFALVLATAIVPFEIYMIPLYLQIKDLNLVNTFPSLFLPYLVMSFGIFFMRQNIIQQIPDELMEAARVEGASEWTIFLKIILPLCKAPISALAIFAFIEAWNAFIWPLLVMGEKTLYTMELGLAMLQSSFGIELNIVSAGAVISVLPILFVFLILRKHIIESVAQTGLK